ncbi:MAG TPA: hypothetical protein VK809_10815 [Bacteroidia bacterium]|jgi:hypothetical protein|nr:hypothetical protein [Bacteroidia bacterium]
MKIKDNIDGVVRLDFSELDYVNPQQPSQFLKAILSINVDDFKVKTMISAEISDFEEILTGFKILHKTLTQTFYFQHNDQRVVIKFAPDKTGHICVSGTVKSVDYKTSLVFEFYTDQTFLPEIIEKLEKEIDKVKIGI